MATKQERYFDDCKKLIMTLRIKSTMTASLINDEFLRLYGAGYVDESRPETWKYYLNMCGEYHVSDVPMVVTSLDTQEQIEFTKANLKIHTATAEAYRYGSRFFYSLLSRYPQQEFLIFGILYPAQMAEAIEAADHTILAYDASFVEPQEQTLIWDLQQYIYGYQHRWHVAAFGISDNLYPAAQFAILYLNLFSKLQSLRLARCHTSEAHSFHIREYLASNGRLDRYMRYMTVKQQLWLYRNLRYIQRHTGLQEQFDVLIEKLFSDRRIPVSEYTVRYQEGYDDELYNRVRVRAKSINPQYNTPEVEYLSLNRLHHQEAKLVYGNAKYQDQHRPRIDHMLKTRDTTVTLTKDLGSSMVDYSDAVPDPLLDIRIRQWAYMANHGLYRTYINFKDPITSTPVSMRAKDAFILFVYLWSKSLGLSSIEIPTFRGWKFQRHPLPTVEDLLSVVEIGYESGLHDIAAAMLKRRPSVTGISSIKAFDALCLHIYEASFLDWATYANEGDAYTAAMIRNMSFRIHGVKDFRIASQTTFQQWADSLNFVLPDYDSHVYEEYMLEVFNAATGIGSGGVITIGDVQRAMVAIMTQLSSYSVQFITDINDSNIKPLNWSAIRPMNFHVVNRHYLNVVDNITVIDSQVRSKQTLDMTSMIDPSAQIVSYVNQAQTITVELPSYYAIEGDDSVRKEILMSPHTLEITTL